MSDYWIGVLTGLTIWGIKELWAFFKHIRKPNSHDKELWEKISARLTPSVQYWQDRDMSHQFPAKILSEIAYVADDLNSSQPEYIFMSSGLSKLAKTLTETSYSFSSFVLRHFKFSSVDASRRYLVSEDDFLSPETYYKAEGILDTANTKRRNFLNAYNQLHAYANRKLINKKY